MGLGIRKLHDVHLLFNIKSCWKLLLKGSLWSKFCNNKYKVGVCGWLKQHSFASLQWRKLMDVVPWVISNSKWLIDKGNRSFWMDKWWSEGILFDKLGVSKGIDLNVTISDVFHHSDLFIDDIGDESLLVRRMWRDLRNLQVDSAGNDDKLIWLHSASGLFSIQSTAL